jgi:3-oxoadipate CoA-transferase beta subunit
MTVQTADLSPREMIAQRIAQDIPEGWHVNLGIGVPTLVSGFTPEGREVIFHSENGILGMGPLAKDNEIDHWVANAGKQHVTLLPGASIFDHSMSFAMIRGGHIDLCVLGAYQIAENGDLANWSTSLDDAAPAVGGAMDLAAGARNIWIATDHVTKKGEPKLVESCSYPLTASGVVKRIYTDLATIDVTPEGFKVRAMSEGVDFDTLQSKTGATLIPAD